MNYIDVIHPGKSGDIVLCLALLKRIMNQHGLKARLTIDPSPFYDEYNQEKARKLRRLIERQSYVDEVIVCPGKTKDEYQNYKVYDRRHFDLDLRRWSDDFRPDRCARNILGHLVAWVQSKHPTIAVKLGDLAQPWIDFGGESPSPAFGGILLNRTERDTTPDDEWQRVLQEYSGNDMRFIGTDAEHLKFIYSVRNVECLPAEDVFELASHIHHAEKLIASQSLPMCLSHALGSPLLGMVTKEVHDCVFLRQNAQYNTFGLIDGAEYEFGV